MRSFMRSKIGGMSGRIFKADRVLNRYAKGARFARFIMTRGPSITSCVSVEHLGSANLPRHPRKPGRTLVRENPVDRARQLCQHVDYVNDLIKTGAEHVVLPALPPLLRPHRESPTARARCDLRKLSQGPKMLS